MKKDKGTTRPRLKFFLATLFALSTVASYYGAINLIENGGGSTMGLSHDFLDTTIVDYLFVGVLAYYAIGLFNLVVLVMLLGKDRNYKWLVSIEGAVLLIWTVIQLILLGFPLIPLHLLLIALGITFILTRIFGAMETFQ